MKFLLSFCLLIVFTSSVFAGNIINAVVKSDRAVIYADKEMTSPIGYIKKGKPVKVGNRASKHIPLIVSKRIVWADRSDFILETDQAYTGEEWRLEQAEKETADQGPSRSYRELVDKTFQSRVTLSLKPLFDLQNLTRPLATDPPGTTDGLQTEVWYERNVGQRKSTVGIGIVTFKISDPLMDFDFSAYAPGLKINPRLVEMPWGIGIAAPLGVFGFPENFKEKSGVKHSLILLGANAGLQAEIFFDHVGFALGTGVQYVRLSGFKNQEGSLSDMERYNRGVFTRFAAISLICAF
jgi:hypothetical protein